MIGFNMNLFPFQSSPVGQAGLGIMYLQGRGVAKDARKAYRLFNLAADAGNVDGQLYAGIMQLREFWIRLRGFIIVLRKL